MFIALAWSVHIVSVTLAKCTSFCLLFRKQWKVMKRNWLSFPGGKPKNGLYTFYVVYLKGKIVSMGLTRLGTLHKLSLFWARQRGQWYCTVYCLFCTSLYKNVQHHWNKSKSDFSLETIVVTLQDTVAKLMELNCYR